MIPSRMSAIEKLLAHFAKGGDDVLEKLSPKSAAVEIEAPSDEGSSELPPELLMQLMEALKGAGTPEGDETDPGELKLAHGGQVMGDTRCAGCGNMNSDCVCSKRSEGGLIEEDGLQDEVMKRREADRKAEQDKNAGSDMAELAGGKPKGKPATVRKMSEGGVVEDDDLQSEVMKRRESERKADDDHNASNDTAELASGKEVAPKQWSVRGQRKSRYWKE